MAVCVDCGKWVSAGKYQRIETKRNTVIYICNKCVEASKKGEKCKK